MTPEWIRESNLWWALPLAAAVWWVGRRLAGQASRRAAEKHKARKEREGVRPQSKP